MLKHFYWLLTLAIAACVSAEPPKNWVDKDTGYRVVRITDEPGSGSLYFNENGYTPDGKEMVYTTREAISAVILADFTCKQVVKGKASPIVVGRKTPRVFYVKDNALYATDIDSLQTQKIGSVPSRGNISAINADETIAAGTYLEGEAQPPSSPPKNKGQMMVERLHARLPIVLFTIDLRTGERKDILHSTDWINHLLFSPTDPNLLMYCHEGPWQEVDRIWTIRTDGSDNRLIHQRTMAMEIAGHEFWSRDGKTIWYDLQTPKGEDFWVAGYQIDTGAKTWYHLQRNE